MTILIGTAGHFYNYMITIPIFPLNLVIFPKSRYPLHIFEERYKKMITRCMSESTGFGVLPIIDKELSNIGSYVIISSILKKYENDEMDIIVTGVGRFLLRDIRVHPDGYNIADIDEYNDHPENVNKELLYEMQNKFEKIIGKIHFQLEDSFWNNYFNSTSKSFKLAEKSGLSLKQQQALLEIQKENERINFLIDHFEKLDSQISDNSVLKTIIMSDGYINEQTDL
ncbi:MAG: LON peptidase substrate-binding domain-containing protein [Ignavibacteriaceae bacterium]